MTFKVGDKVRCVVGNGGVLKKGDIHTVFGVDERYIYIEKNNDSDGWWVHRFELVKQPEPQVGDVWGSEDKSEVVKIVGKFIGDNGSPCLSSVYLKGKFKGRVTEIKWQLFKQFFTVLLHRPPKKQPQVVEKQPKKQEEVWERIFQSNEDYRCGNKIKVIYQGYEGLAVCNKHDKFDLMFGVNLAAHRAMVKYHQKVIDEMIKEGVK